MGLIRRKKSGKILSGSRLIVSGLPIYAVKVIPKEFKKPKRFDADDVILPTTTTTTTIPVDTCYIITQDNNELITQNGDNLIWC